MQAHKILQEKFSRKHLENLYEEKISKSLAIGSDGTSHMMFSEQLPNELDIILRKTLSEEYQFTRYKEKLISKGPFKPPRQISIPTIRDRLTLRALTEILNQVFIDSKIRPPHEYIKSIQQELKTAPSDSSFVRIDIQNYYPSIPHDILMSRVRSRIRKKELVSLVNQAISTPTGQNSSNILGVPQGLSISSILSSIYLALADDRFSKLGFYRRYVDDILLICPTSEAESLLKKITNELKRKYGLTCHELNSGTPGKTHISTIQQGVEYLGFEINSKTTKIRTSSYKKIFTTLANLFSSYRHNNKSEAKLLWQLNLKITGCLYKGKRYGWLFFFAQTEDKSQISRLDNFVKQQLSKHDLEVSPHSLKRFIKAYHEIRFNFDESSYFPRFDDYSIEEMIELISVYENVDNEAITTKLPEEIQTRFFKIIDQETHELDQDLLETTS